MNDYLSSPDAKKEFLAYQFAVKSILEKSGYALQLDAKNQEQWAFLMIQNTKIAEASGKLETILGFSPQYVIGQKISNLQLTNRCVGTFDSYCQYHTVHTVALCLYCIFFTMAD